MAPTAKPLGITTTPIPGFLRIDLTVHGDNRGWFKENWQREKMVARHRRITAALLLGKTQVEIARAEKLSQQAISDFARGTGAGLIQSSLIIAEAARA